MILTLLDRVGDYNPQFLREVKGRLKGRNTLIVLTISFVIQALTILCSYDLNCKQHFNNTCVYFAWQGFWLGIFRSLDWIGPLVLFSLGVYILISDLVREHRRGTINFIRLSPQSSQTILLGKLLGVPILVYLGIASALPLHFIAGIAAGVGFGRIIAFYTLIGVACAFLYTTILLNSELTQAPYQAIAGSFVGGWLGSSYIGLIEFTFDWDHLTFNKMWGWRWFFWTVGDQGFLLTLWTIITISVCTYWIWQAANRLFHNPNHTLLSKAQSYGLVGSFQIWLWGLFWGQLPESGHTEQALFTSLGAVSVINLFLFIALIWAISPQRQILLDWARYDQLKLHFSFKTFKGLWPDLVKGTRSPSPVAIALNLAITGAIMLPWVLVFPVSLDVKIKAIAGLILSANLIWIYALITQGILLSKIKKPGIFAAIVLSLVIFFPMFSLSVFGLEKIPELGLISVFGSPWLSFTNGSVSLLTLGFSIFAQWAIALKLSFYLTQQLRRAGESASKPLFAPNSDRLNRANLRHQ